MRQPAKSSIATLGGLSIRARFSLSLLTALITGILFTSAQSQLPNKGYLPLIAFCIGLILIPTSQALSSRIAINGVLMLGLLPVLWWGTSSMNIAHLIPTSAFATFLIISIASFLSALTIFSKQRWLPIVKPSEIFLFLAAAFMVWLYLPFINGASASAALMQSMGGDIVAHFTMVIKTIETEVSGSGWGIAPDSTPFVYVNYPQHFHTIAAYFGQSFTRSSTGIIESHSSEFMGGLAFTIIFSVIILASMMLGILKDYKGFFLPGLLVIAATASIGAGFGATNVQAGFPNFVLAAVGVLFTFFFAVQKNTVRSIDFIASASAVLLVINSWFLLSPIALGLLAITFWRYLLSPLNLSAKKWGSSVTAFGLVAVGYAWSLYLITAASSGIGGPLNVLSVPGGTPSMPLGQVLGMSLVVLAMGIFLATQTRKGIKPSPIVPAWSIIGLVSFSLILLVGLIIFQRLQGATASYYQQKLANGIYLIMSVALVAAIVFVLQNYLPKLELSSRIATWGLWSTCWIGTFLMLSSIPGFISGLEMRAGVAREANNITEASQRITNAATLITNLPCKVPAYLALQEGDPAFDISNQWSHALSGTWTESSGAINSYLSNQSTTWDFENKSKIVEDFLNEFPDTCVVVSPEISQAIKLGDSDNVSDRVFTW